MADAVHALAGKFEAAQVGDDVGEANTAGSDLAAGGLQLLGHARGSGKRRHAGPRLI